MRRPHDQIDAEAERLAKASDPMDYDNSCAIDLAERVLRQRMSPGQVQTAHGNRPRHEFDAAMAAANWTAGLDDTKPSDVLLPRCSWPQLSTHPSG